MIVHFHAKQFAETADLFVDEISWIANLHDLHKRLLDIEYSPSPDGPWGIIFRLRSDENLMRLARGGEDLAVDHEKWHQVRDLVDRLDALLANGNIHLFDCRSTTRRRLTFFWEFYSHIAEPFRCATSSPQWPLIEEQDVKKLHGVCMLVREAEGVVFATPDEEQEWVQKAAWQKVKSEGLFKTKSEWLAYLLTHTEGNAKSQTDFCVELLLPAVTTSDHVERSIPDAPNRVGWPRQSSDAIHGEAVETTLSAEVTPQTSQETTPPGIENEAPRRVPKEPSSEAFAAYRIQVSLGWTQKQIAEQLTQEFRRPIDQGSVSRMLTQVRKFLKAGGELLPLTSVESVDPKVIELGARQDHQTQRQRFHRTTDE